jgi:hypothetical protein
MDLLEAFSRRLDPPGWSRDLTRDTLRVLRILAGPQAAAVLLPDDAESLRSLAFVGPGEDLAERVRPLWERHRAGLEAGRTAFEPGAHSRDVVVVPIRPHGALRALLCVEVDEEGWNRLGRIESFAQVLARILA